MQYAESAMIFLEITSIIPFIINGNFSNEWNEVVTTLSLTDKWLDVKYISTVGCEIHIFNGL